MNISKDIMNTINDIQQISQNEFLRIEREPFLDSLEMFLMMNESFETQQNHINETPEHTKQIKNLLNKSKTDLVTNNDLIQLNTTIEKDIQTLEKQINDLKKENEKLTQQLGKNKNDDWDKRTETLNRINDLNILLFIEEAEEYQKIMENYYLNELKTNEIYHYYFNIFTQKETIKLEMNDAAQRCGEIIKVPYLQLIRNETTGEIIDKKPITFDVEIKENENMVNLFCDSVQYDGNTLLSQTITVNIHIHEEFQGNENKRRENKLKHQPKAMFLNVAMDNFIDTSEKKDREDEKENELQSKENEKQEKQEQNTQEKHQEEHQQNKQKEEQENNNNVNLIQNEPDIVEFSVPIQHYITCEPFVFEYNGYSFQSDVNGEIPDGQQFYCGKCGKSTNGQPRDLIIEFRMDTNNETYQRYDKNPALLIQQVAFSIQYQGLKTDFDFPMPDGSMQHLNVDLVAGYKTIVKNQGLMKSNGQRDDLIVIIVLQ